MEHITKETSQKRLKKLERIIRRQAKIQKKAEIVMSKFPPGPQFSISLKAKYIKPKIKIDLPPLKIRVKEPKKEDSSCQTPYLKVTKNSVDLGVLKGYPKYLSKRLNTKSLELSKNKSSSFSFSLNRSLNKSINQISALSQLSKLTNI